MNESGSTPYCGTPPVPTEIWARWNDDPILIGTLASLCILHAWRLGLFSKTQSETRRVTIAFCAGWAALSFALVSPLCALSVSLFSARVAQHMWLVTIAAPLLVLASPSKHPSCDDRPSLSPFMASGLFAISLWIWHWPHLYALTFVYDVVYWAMHITMTGTAILLWRSLLQGRGHQALARVSGGFVTLTHMGLLGALITFAARPLYMPHLLTAPVWNLTALEDQQLGGLIMWIPTGAVFLIATLVTMYSTLRAQDAAAAGNVRGAI